MGNPFPGYRRCACIVAVLMGSGALAQPARAQHGLDAFHRLNEINKASLIMVVEQEIVPRSLGTQIASALAEVIADAEVPSAPRSGDYLQVEQLLIAAGGPEVTRLHSGRSRQDIGATMRRLFLRDDLLVAAEALNAARESLLEKAEAHADAIMPAYTWGVQAQPISFGHYLLGYSEALARSAERLRQAWARLNLSPLGAAALGTSSFPVNRPRLAELLGFDGVIENSLDANQISPVDSGVELVSIAASSALTINLLLADITTQYAQTRPWLVLSEGASTGVSSIMPQKRNPTGIVRLRALGSTVLGDAQSYLVQAHNVGSGMHDYKGDQPNHVLQQAGTMFESLASLIDQLELDEERALDEVNAEYSTTTELANTLQREAGVAFRVGHHFASELVNFGRGNGLRPSEIPYAEAQRIYSDAARTLGMSSVELPLDETSFRRALRAENMVRTSKGLGGPQPAEVRRMLAEQTSALDWDRQWLGDTRDRLAGATERLDEAFEQLRTGP